MPSIIELNGIEKSFAELQVLQGVDLKVESGEIICLLGPSGSGKTTLFRMIAGLLAPDRGSVRMDDSLRRGYIFQEPRLLPWRTAEENVRLVQKKYLPAAEAELIRSRLFELTGLDNFKQSYPSQLSGGMKQRLEMVRALSLKPELLLLDEPFKSIDTRTKVNMRQLLLKFVIHNKLSVFHITHDPEEAVLLADRIYVLSPKPGKIIAEFTLSTDRRERSLQVEEVYRVRERIIDLFMEMVSELKEEEIFNGDWY